MLQALINMLRRASFCPARPSFMIEHGRGVRVSKNMLRVSASKKMLEEAPRSRREASPPPTCRKAFNSFRRDVRDDFRDDCRKGTYTIHKIQNIQNIKNIKNINNLKY